MRLIKTIKAQVYTAVTKDELMRWVTYGKYYTVMNHGGSWFRGYVDEKYKYAMNFEKRKKKTSRSLLYGNVVTQEKSWTCWVYKFPRDFPIAIKQNPRNFEFKY